MSRKGESIKLSRGKRVLKVTFNSLEILHIPSWIKLRTKSTMIISTASSNLMPVIIIISLPSKNRIVKTKKLLKVNLIRIQLLKAENNHL